MTRPDVYQRGDGKTDTFRPDVVRTSTPSTPSGDIPTLTPAGHTPYRPVDAIFAGRRDAIDARICFRCREPVDFDGFTDPIARAEYTLSGLCEGCQAVVYAQMEELAGE